MKRMHKGLVKGLAVFLAVLMIFSGSGMPVFAEGISETLSETAESNEEVTEESLEEIPESSEPMEESSETSEVLGMEEVFEESSESSENTEESSENSTELLETSEEIVEPEEENVDATDNKASIKAQGNWGKSVHWKVDSDGVLTITQDKGVKYEYFTDEAPWADYCRKLKKIVWGANILREEDGNVQTAFVPGAYLQYSSPTWCENVEEIEFLDNVDMSYVTDMSEMFAFCYNLKTIKFKDFDTSNVTDMSCMFTGLNLETIDLSFLDTSKVTTMRRMFMYCDMSTFDLTLLDFSNVTDMGEMFAYCKLLKSVNMTNLDLSNVEDMGDMFYECTSLTSVDLSTVKVENLKDISSMFYYCKALERVNFGNFDTSTVTDMRGLFGYCEALKKVDTENINTSNVTNMAALFYFTDFTELDLSNFDTSNVTSMRYMFNQCSVRELDLSNFDTSNVTDMEQMFSYASSLSSVNLSSFDTSNVTCMNKMFYYCPNLVELDLSNFDFGNVNSANNMFSDIDALAEIKTPINVNVDILIEGEWVRTDTSEAVTSLPKELNESITLRKTTDIPLKNISVEPWYLYMEVGETAQLTPVFRPLSATNKNVRWSSSNSSVVSVDENGVITAHKLGSADIKVISLENEEITATCSVSVVVLATEIEVSLDRAMNEEGVYVLTLGDSMYPIVDWIGGSVWGELEWKVSNDTAVVEDALFISQKAGRGVLTATAKNGDKYGPSASIEFIVYPEKVSGISLNADKVILNAHSNDTFYLEASIDNEGKAYSEVRFSVDKPEVVSIVSQNNNRAMISITDPSAGTATITAMTTDGTNKSATCMVIVGEPVRNISVGAALETDGAGKYILQEGKSAKLTADIVPTNATIKALRWKSSNEEVVKVDQTGKITATGLGAAFVDAVALDGSGVWGGIEICVTHPAKAMKMEILYGASDGKVILGNKSENRRFKLKATLTDENGEMSNVSQEVKYSVSGKGAKNVSHLGDGEFAVYGPGEIVVTATAQDGSKVKSSVKLSCEYPVITLDATPPKNVIKYTDSGNQEHWIVYLGSKNITLKPKMIYNNGDKSWAPAKAYQKYSLSFDKTYAGNTLVADSKGTGIVISKDTQPDTYGVTIESNGVEKKIYIDVVPAQTVYIKKVSISLPNTVATSQSGTQYLAEGSKVKLTGVLNDGEKTKGYTLTWDINGAESNEGTAEITKAGVLDLTKAKPEDSYTISLKIAKGDVSLSKNLEIIVTKKTEASLMRLVEAYNEEAVFPTEPDMLYTPAGFFFKVANQEGAANRYRVTGGKKGVLEIISIDDLYMIALQGVGSANITITALDGSNTKNVLKIKVKPVPSPINKITTGSKTYYVEAGREIAIPYNVTTKNAAAASDASIFWTSSNSSILSLMGEYPAEGGTVTEQEKGYIYLYPKRGMTGKVTVTGKALDGSKKSVKITVNVVNSNKKEVAYGLSLDIPASTPNGNVKGLALLTHGKKVKLSANLMPSKSKNKTVTYSIVGVDKDGNEVCNEADLKEAGVTVKKGVVEASKKCTYTGFVKVTAQLSYATYFDDEVKPVMAEKVLYIQAPATNVVITNIFGEEMTETTLGRGCSTRLAARVTGAVELTYANVIWTVSDPTIATIDQDGIIKISESAAYGKTVKAIATAADGSKKKAEITIRVY